MCGFRRNFVAKILKTAVTLTIEMRETNKVGHVKLLTNEIEALTHEMNKFDFVKPIFVVKSELTQIGPFKSL